MWKNEILIWEDTPNSNWNNFGEITDIPNSYDDDLYAKGLVIWKKSTLGDFVENSISLFESGQEFIEDRNILTGTMLAISVVSFVPLHVEIIKDDDIANKFLSLIQREKTQHFILKKEFEESEFGKNDSLKLLIADLINNDVLTETDDKYIINGKVLKSVHLWDSED